MKQSTVIGRSFVLVCILSLFLALGVLVQGCTESKSSPASLTGKKIYFPSDEETETDKKSGLTVIKDIINVIITPGTDAETIEKILSSVDGEIVGYDIPNSLYQIRVKVADLPALDAVALKLLRKYKPVESTSRCPVSVHKDPYYVR